MQMPSEATRAWIYRVLVALIPLLVAYGLLTGEQATLIATLLSALLGVAASGLASLNTTTKPSDPEE